MNEQFIRRNRRLRHNVAKLPAPEPIIAIENIEVRKLALCILDRKYRIHFAAALKAGQRPLENFLILEPLSKLQK